MTTYALLIYRATPGTEQLPRTSEEQTLTKHRRLQAESAAEGQLHAVARLASPTTAHAVRVQASGHEVTDGPFIEAKEWLVGFYLIDCLDEAQALDRARQLCADEHHAIEVRPVTWRWRT